MKLYVYQRAVTCGFQRFSAWLDGRKEWEQNLVVGLILLAIPVLAALLWQTLAFAWGSFTP